MATTKIAVSPEINDDVLEHLIETAGCVVGNYTIGFNAQAAAKLEDFWNDPANPTWFGKTAGQTYAEYDYAFIELMKPERREAMAASFEAANAFRAEHYGEPACQALPIDVQSAIRVANRVLDAVAKEQDADRLIDADSVFWEDFVGEIFAFYDSGETTDRS